MLSLTGTSRPSQLTEYVEDETRKIKPKYYNIQL